MVSPRTLSPPFLPLRVHISLTDPRCPVRDRTLTFSYGRALQASVLKAWNGSPKNVKKAQDALYERCEANGKASRGEYLGSGKAGAAGESLYVKSYAY